MKKTFYFVFLMLGLASCNGSTEQPNAPLSEDKPAEKVETETKCEAEASKGLKQTVTKDFVTAYINNDGQVSFQFNEKLAEAYAEKHNMPNRLDGSIYNIEEFTKKCKQIVFFGQKDELFLGMLTENGKVAILDILKVMETGDRFCSDEMQNLPTFTAISSADGWLYATTEKGEKTTISTFELPGYYMCDDYEIKLTKDYTISFTSTSAELFKNGTFYSDPDRLADGPDAKSQVLVAVVDGKKYEIEFGYDHFELPANSEKRSKYYFILNSKDFALSKGVKLIFKRHSNSQIAG